MSSFVNEDTFKSYPIDSLPEFITDSGLFIRTLDMCPSMTEFYYDSNRMVLSTKIKSHEDFEKLIDADQMFGFTSKVKIEILENMYNFWLEDPNSSQLPLPIKDFSHFGNQVRALFLESETILPVRCFQGNYVELFDYLVKRDGVRNVDSRGRWPDYTLPFYGAVCNNVEIVKRGLELELSVADDIIDEAIKQNNLEMFKLLINDKNVRYTSKTLDVAARQGAPEIYKHFLGVVRGDSIMSIRKYVLKTLHNKANLEYLLRESDVNLRCVNGVELLQECIREGFSAEIIQLVNEYFIELDGDSKPLICKLQEIEGFANIPQKVVYNEDLELFMYLQSKGFLIKPSLIDYVINVHKSPKFTPGFLKQQYAEQQVALERMKQEEDEKIEHQID
jgi:hypothetical protein